MELLSNEPKLDDLAFELDGVRPTWSEVMYFVQGFIEISDCDENFKQIYLTDSQQKTMIEFFKFNLDGYPPEAVAIFELITEEHPSFEELQKALYPIFQHKIDNSYGLTEEEMKQTQDIHDSYFDNQ